VTALTITEDTAKTIEQFHDFKYLVNQISDSVGVKLGAEESFAIPIILLRNLLGEDKFKIYMDKLRISGNNHLN